MTEKQRFKKIRSKHLLDFRRFIRLDGSGSCVYDWIGMNAWELREYIQSQWLDGMNWDNYGKYWIVDHIVALKYFNPTNDSEMKMCWNFTNLKPVLYWDNHAKGYCVTISKNVLLGMRPSGMVQKLLSFIDKNTDMFNPYYKTAV